MREVRIQLTGLISGSKSLVLSCNQGSSRSQSGYKYKFSLNKVSLLFVYLLLFCIQTVVLLVLFD